MFFILFQIVYARFGKATHIMFCVLAFVTNLSISTAALLAGRTAIQVLSKDTTNEFVFLIIAVLFGCYCMIGGLGTTFYVSYLKTAITFLSVTVDIIYTSFYHHRIRKTCHSRKMFTTTWPASLLRMVTMTTRSSRLGQDQA